MTNYKNAARRVARAYSEYTGDPKKYLAELSEALDDLCTLFDLAPPYFPQRCAQVGCNTFLSRYNPGDRCAPHTPKVFDPSAHLPLRGGGNGTPKGNQGTRKNDGTRTKKKRREARPYEPSDQSPFVPAARSAAS